MIVDSEYVCDWCGNEVIGLLPMVCDVCGDILCPICAYNIGCCDGVMKEANEFQESKMKKKFKKNNLKPCDKCYGLGYEICLTIENEDIAEVKVLCDKCKGKGK